MEKIVLNNGVKMPILGYGTFQTPPSLTAQNVQQALAMGYRSIDTAQVYNNERGVGQAIANSDLKREDVFVTSKTATTGYAATKQGIDESLQRLGSDYVDLLIIHWPADSTTNLETYRALEDALKAGKARSIGLSNFNTQQINHLLAHSTVTPVIDQIETHLYWQQAKMRPYLAQHRIAHEAWAPLGENMGREMMALPEIQTLAQKYAVSPAQLLLRFLTQQKIIVIPKSLKSNHVKANLDSLNFNLTPTEIKQLTRFDRHHSIKDWPQSMRESAY